MNKTLIEWVKNPDGSQGMTWNPITGCNNHIDGMCKGGNFPCYAHRLANGRLKVGYLANTRIAPIGTMIPGAAMGEKALKDPFHPRLWEERFYDLGEPDGYGYQVVGKPKGIFVCDMSDLFGIGVPDVWTARVLMKIQEYPEHRFYLSTKQPQNLPEWSPFPDNCWVGVTATDTKMALEACLRLGDIEATVRYLSLEPMLNSINLPPEHLTVCKIRQAIIGAMTCKAGDILHRGNKYPGLTPMPWGGKWTLQPKIEWVEEIVRACDKAGIPVFLKNNLVPLLSASSDPRKADLFYSGMGLRQEMPK